MKWKQLHDPPPPTTTIILKGPSLFLAPLTVFPPSSPRTSVFSLSSFSFSVLPGCCRVEGMSQTYWLYKRRLDPVLHETQTSRYNREGAGLETKYKSCNRETRILRREKRCCVNWSSRTAGSSRTCVVGTSGEPVQRGRGERSPLCRKMLIFLNFIFGVLGSRWSLLMLNPGDTGSISSIKQNLEGFY